MALAAEAPQNGDGAGGQETEVTLQSEQPRQPNPEQDGQSDGERDADKGGGAKPEP